MKAKTKQKTPSSPRQPWWDRRTRAFLFLLALVVIAYGQTILFGFSWFDDDAILLRNQEYISDFSNLTDAVLRDAEFREQNMELYRPLQNITFMLDAALGGFSPGMFHFTNLLLHFVAVWLLFVLLNHLGFTSRLSLAGATILAIHPVFTFAVGWIPARGDLLLAVTTLASFLFFVKFLNNKKPKWLTYHLIAFGAALLAKESALIIIPVCTLFYLLQKDHKPTFQRWQLWAALTYVALIIPYFMMRAMSIAPVQGGAFGLSSLIHNLPVMFEAMLKFFVPYPIVALPFYSLPVTIAGVIITLVILWVLLRKKLLRDPLVLTGIAWYAGFTFPSMFYRPDWSVYIYDYIIHRSYLPLVGVIWVVLVIYARFFADEKLPGRYRWVPVGILAMYMVMSFSLVRVFKEPLTFWQYAVKTNPESAFAHTYLGGTLFFTERHAQAIASYNRALELKPDFGEALLNRGITHAAMGNHPLAIADFSQYLQQVPGDTMALRYRGLSYAETGEYALALPDFKEVVNQGDRSEKVHYSLGVAMLIGGDFAGAVRIMDSLILQQPNNVAYLRVGGLASLMANKADDAIARYLRVLTTDPSSNTLSNLGYAYWEKGAYPEALDHFQRAAGSGEMNLSIAVGLMLVYDAMGMTTRALEMKKEVLRLEPEYLSGPEAIQAMQKKGYLFTDRQLRALNRLFPKP